MARIGYIHHSRTVRYTRERGSHLSESDSNGEDGSGGGPPMEGESNVFFSSLKFCEPPFGFWLPFHAVQEAGFLLLQYCCQAEGHSAS